MISIRSMLATTVSGILAAALVAVPAIAPACDLCAIYTGTLGQQEKTGLWLGVAEQYSDFGTIRTDGHKVANPHDEWVHSSITQLLVGYSITSFLSIQANIPLISREYQRIESGEAARGDANGLGDVSFLARVTPFSGAVGPTLLHAELIAGVKTPTGSGDRLAEELAPPADFTNAASGGSSAARPFSWPRHEGHESAVHGHDLTLGTGSVDGVFGIGLHGSCNRVFVNAAVQYVIRGRGDYDYTFANDLTWETGPGVFLVTDDRYTASLQFVVSGEDKGKDEQYGVVADDTATTAVYVGPGLAATWKESLSAQFAVDIPVLQDESATQIVTDYRLRGGLVWRF